MNKVVLSALAALAVSAAPAFAADMPVKALKAPVAAPSPWDVAFGVAFQTDYRLRGVSQSNKHPSENGYFEVDYTATDWLKFYAGVHGYTMYYGYADGEFDLSGGARFTWGNFGLDVGYVYYGYLEGIHAGVLAGGAGNGSFGDFYAIPSYKVNDWLTLGAVVDYGNNNNNGVGIIGSKDEGYYSGNATITLPAFMPYGIVTSVNPEVGRQWARCTGCTDFTYWDVGLDFNYKAVTLDLRYWGTDLGTKAAAFNAVNTNVAGNTFVATLKFDTTLSALK
ncbi:MAG TPA: TorF family putative porin [Pseudolabrys sp.]